MKSGGMSSETVVTESETKFFLDRKSGKLYHVRKFFDGSPVSANSAKIHLQRAGEFVNCRSYVCSRAGVSSMIISGGQVGVAESRSGNPIDSDDYQNGASGTSQWGALVPGKYGRKRISYVSKNEERGWKGEWSYCLIR